MTESNSEETVEPTDQDLKDAVDLAKVGKSETLSTGIALVTKGTRTNYRLKNVGLMIAQMGVAEIQAVRVQRMMNLICRVEEKVFSKAVIEDLKPGELLSLYRLAITSLDSAASYLATVSNMIDLNEIEAQLIKAESGERAGLGDAMDRKSKEIVVDLIRTIHAQKAEGSEVDDALIKRDR